MVCSPRHVIARIGWPLREWTLTPVQPRQCPERRAEPRLTRQELRPRSPQPVREPDIPSRYRHRAGWPCGHSRQCERATLAEIRSLQRFSCEHRPVTDVRAALAAGRAACLDHMTACEVSGLQWTEEPVTEILLSRTAPQVRFATFTRNQEATVGADWLWWWVAPSGESFGMLVQAKRLYVDKAKWSFGFDYKSGDQRRALFKAAYALNVAPVYSLYLGTQRYRGAAVCGAYFHDAEDCQNCAVLAVSLMPALLAVSHLVVDDRSTYTRSVALETAFDNAEEQSAWLGAIDADLTDDLRDFLTEPQTGARAIARSLVDRVLEVRQGQFSKNVEEMIRTERLGRVFPDLPGDYGHFGAPYMPMMLRGLVQSPPDYVVSIIAGDRLGEPPADNIAGVVLVQLGSG